MTKPCTNLSFSGHASNLGEGEYALLKDPCQTHVLLPPLIVLSPWRRRARATWRFLPDLRSNPYLHRTLTVDLDADL